MGIRSRIKGRIKKLAGANEPAEPPARREPPPREPAPAPTPVAGKPAAAPAPAPPTNPVPEAADEPKVDDEAKPVDEAKVARHRAKAQRGVLKHLHKEGGTMSMKDLHDYSERRWFIAHAGFSRMMEFFVEDRYVDFDHDSYTVVLTDDGRYFMKSPVN
jgi:hypothetical protein